MDDTTSRVFACRGRLRRERIIPDAMTIAERQMSVLIIYPVLRSLPFSSPTAAIL